MVITDKNDVRGRDLFLELLLRKDGIVFPELLGEFAKVSAAARRHLATRYRAEQPPGHASGPPFSATAYLIALPYPVLTVWP